MYDNYTIHFGKHKKSQLYDAQMDGRIFFFDEKWEEYHRSNIRVMVVFCVLGPPFSEELLF